MNSCIQETHTEAEKLLCVGHCVEVTSKQHMDPASRSLIFLLLTS